MRPLVQCAHRYQPGFQPGPVTALPGFLKAQQWTAPDKLVPVNPEQRTSRQFLDPLGQVARGQPRLLRMAFQPGAERRGTFAPNGDPGEVQRQDRKSVV